MICAISSYALPGSRRAAISACWSAVSRRPSTTWIRASARWGSLLVGSRATARSKGARGFALRSSSTSVAPSISQASLMSGLSPHDAAQLRYRLLAPSAEAQRECALEVLVGADVVLRVG
jgi:hypothetical protein